MAFQPCRQGLGRALGQQIDGAAPLQVARDSAVGAFLAPRPVIDAKHARRGVRSLPNAVQQRGAADRRRQRRGDARTAVAAQALMQAPQALGMTRPRPGNAGQTFAEGPPRTPLVDAAKATNMNQQHHRPAEARQIACTKWTPQGVKAAPVMAMNPIASNPAFTTGCRCADPSGAQGDPAEARIDLVNDLEMREQIKRVESDRQFKSYVVSIRIHMSRHAPKKDHHGTPPQSNSNGRSVSPSLCTQTFEEPKNGPLNQGYRRSKLTLLMLIDQTLAVLVSGRVVM